MKCVRMSKPAVVWFLLVLTVVSSVPAAGQDEQFEDLETRLGRLIEDHEGDFSVVVRHINSGRELAIEADRVMPTASLIKVAVMVAVYREADAGQLDLATRIELQEEDKVRGSGVLTRHFSAGATLSIRDLVRAMIVWSDNTATNLVINQIGLSRIGEIMDELDFAETRIHAQVYRRDTSIDPKNSAAFGLGRTTAAEMSRLLEMIHDGSAASTDSCAAMIDHLRACESDTRLARLFPSVAVFAHKTGAVNAVRTDAGILETDAGPVVVCALTANNKDQSWTSTNAADVLLGQIGQAVLKTFSKPWPTRASGPAELQTGDFGEMVEVLQRTLNARLDPSPKLSVDGDFGPQTRAAVIRFQAANELESSGVVDGDVWKKLGPLHFRSEPVSDPEVVNQQELKLAPADADEGEPFVTCDAWAAVDSETGALIAGAAADQALPMASTTKIMTAWLVLRIAEQNPDVLDERLTYSRRADRTRGSTSAIREGESLPVREVLFGLLLPSGNDASVALAEHFGERALALFDSEDDAQEDALLQFVKAMNREAERLGLMSTSYRNPHGLDQSGHQTSASDLAKLAVTALKNEQFRDVVHTRVYGCRVTGKGGYVRNVAWKNTNQLLGITGYGGVKTGTTSRAGACLVSLGGRDDEQTVLVVLGSAASAARYSDSRNLHRWVRRLRSASGN